VFIDYAKETDTYSMRFDLHAEAAALVETILRSPVRTTAAMPRSWPSRS
jgi:hypothetical protein